MLNFLFFVLVSFDTVNKSEIKFFNLGVKNDWKKILDLEIAKNLEKVLNNEMKELGYLK